MIIDWNSLQCYLAADKFALGINRRIPKLIGDAVWKYERTLRLYEWAKNTRRQVLRYVFALRLSRLGMRLGFSISGNCFGPGLRLNHFGLVIVNSKARIGKWCDIHQGVNIGDNGYIEKDGKVVSMVPTIGDYCYIAPGAKIFGNVYVGNKVRIGANAVVNINVDDNKTYISRDIIKDNKCHKLTTASMQTEKDFLTQYPQYKTYLQNI